MHPIEQQLCNSTLNTIKSPELSKINFVFMEPVEVSYFPDYLTKIKKPMDLTTLTTNLEEKRYSNFKDFFHDASLMYHNARIYHKDKAETRHIIEIADNLEKLLKKEEKRVKKTFTKYREKYKEEKKERKKERKEKAKAAQGQAQKSEKSSFSSNKSENSSEKEVVKKEKTKKPSFKLKLSSSNDSKSQGSGGTTNDDKEEKTSSSKTSLKLGKSSKDKSSKTNKDSEKITVKKAKPVSKTIKPKLKLRFGAQKSSSSSSGTSSGSSGPINESKKESTKKESTKKESTKKDSTTTIPSTNSTSQSKKNKSKVKLSLGVKKSITTTDTSNSSNNKSLDTSSKGKRKAESPSTSNFTNATEERKSKKPSKSSTVPTTSTPSSVGAPSRGKELPKAVATEKKEEKKTNAETSSTKASNSKITLVFGNKKQNSSKSSSTSNSKQSGTKSSLSTSATTTPTKSSDGTNLIDPMTDARKSACFKVLSGLKRREPINSSWFLDPQSDPRILEDYKAKIKNPMDLRKMSSKIDKNEYKTVHEFVRDMRRIFANCLRYNTDTESNLRPAALQMLVVAENLMAYFIQKHEPTTIYPPLLYNWKKCIETLDKILELKNSDDKHQTAHFFLHPVSFFFHGKWPAGYLSTISTPMDMGTVVSKLIEGDHRSVQEFVTDCQLVWDNCVKYNGDKEPTLTEKAQRLKKAGEEVLKQLIEKDNYEKEDVKKRGYHPGLKIARAPEAFLLKMLQDLRMTTYTDRRTKFTESATVVFEKPVDTTIFSDYRQFVKCPMNLETVEQKIKNDEYEAPEDFEYDVLLIFKNCESYNVPKKNDLIVLKAKHCAAKFRKLYTSRMKGYMEQSSSGKGKHFEGSSSHTTTNQKSSSLSSVKEKHTKGSDSSSSKNHRKRSRSPNPESSSSSSNKSNKKAKMELKVGSTKTSKSKSLSSGSSGSSTSNNKKSMKANLTKTGKGSANYDENAPLELFDAIRLIKEQYAPRRSIKELEPWEISCSKIMQALLQHPWLRARNARPKFNFHAPVPMVYPEVKVAYQDKIKHPSDLTTVEAKLMQGGHYTSPQKFVDDVALIFSNAIVFNETGRADGEPLACSYHDASKHLICYARWLSLEYLSLYLTVEERQDDKDPLWGPVTHWELTNVNQEDAKQEMEHRVLHQTMIQSDVGDKYSWMEYECEKLLKALRRQTDTRFMTYFISFTHYPPDYSAFVSKPMSWDKVSDNLRQRLYPTLGHIVEDLRLIFSNALKYNVRAKGTETVSGKAYDAAVTMSGKLEVAVDGMLLSVGDRLERDRIDQRTAEREMEALERAKEERAHMERLQRGSNTDRPSSSTHHRHPPPNTQHHSSSSTLEKQVVTYQTLKVIPSRSSKRPSTFAEFDFPLYENEDSHRARTQGEAERQQQLYEAMDHQQRMFLQMQKIALNVGVQYYHQRQEREGLRNVLEQTWSRRSRLKEEVRDNVDDDDHNVDNDRSMSDRIPEWKGDLIAASLYPTTTRDKVTMSWNKKYPTTTKKKQHWTHVILEEF